MKFEKETNVKGAFVPRSALNLCDFKENEALDLHTLPGAALIIRKHMTAAELVETVDALTTVSTHLINHLIQSCGNCDGCGVDGECPYDEPDYIELPDYLREEAGIPLSDKLCAQVDPATHTITIQSAGYKHDLRDIPEGLLAVLRECGVCVGELEERLMTEAVVYG